MLKDKIQDDIKVAVKAKDELASTTLRSLLSEINSKEIELKKKEDGLNEQEEEQTVLREIKKRQDAIEQYQKGGREDLVKNEQEEMNILNKYAPELIDEESLNKIIDDAINELGVSAMQDIGRVMGVVMKKVGNKADGNVVNKLVSQKLQ